MFWAKAKRIPPPIKRAIDALDHFGVSLDVFHEREVDREDVYRVLDTLLAEGKDVSVHLVGLGPDDPYLAERTEEVRERFDEPGADARQRRELGRARGRVAGRARRRACAGRVEAEPCTLANWPLVAFDGTIVACGNDDVVDGPAPAHLRLGHADTHGWPEIRARCVASAMLRSIRTFGPLYTADRHGAGAVTCNGYCTTCQQLSDDPGGRGARRGGDGAPVRRLPRAAGAGARAQRRRGVVRAAVRDGRLRRARHARRPAGARLA